jgi:hypothetical protein
MPVMPLAGQRRDDAAGGAVVGRDDRVDLAADLGQDLLHVLLRDLGLPAVGVLVADDLDVALLHRRVDDSCAPRAGSSRSGRSASP